MAFYLRRGALFESTEHTRGPWSVHHQHGGPPGALLVGRIAATQADAQVARVSLDFLKPVPIAPLRVELEAVSAGRRVRRARGALLDEKGTPLLTAQVVFVQPAPVEPPPPGPEGTPPPPLEGSASVEGEVFPFFPSPVGYHTAMELRFARGRFGAGPVAVWMRQRMPVVEGEAVTPIERVMAVADSVHGVSWRVDPREMSAINPDLHVALHRLPEGEWVCLDGQTANEPSGVGAASSRLWDARGPLGWTLQTLVLARRSERPDGAPR